MAEMSQDEIAVLGVINRATYGQAINWIAEKLQMPYKRVKECCESLYAFGRISKQGNGRYKAKRVI